MYPLTVAAALAGLGIAVDAGAALRISTAALVALLLVVLMHRNRALRKELSEQQRDLIDFADALVDSGLRFDLGAWAEHHSVSRNRSTTTRTITVVNTGLAPLWVCWHQSEGPHGVDEVPERTRQGVRFRVVEMIDGEEAVDCKVHRRWFGPKLRGYIRFTDPIPPGHRRTIKVEIDWPDWRTPLLDDRHDKYQYLFHRSVERFEYRVEFLPDVGLHRQLRVQATGGLPPPATEFRNGTAVVSGAWDNPTSSAWSVVLQR